MNEWISGPSSQHFLTFWHVRVKGLPVKRPHFPSMACLSFGVIHFVTQNITHGFFYEQLWTAIRIHILFFPGKCLEVCEERLETQEHFKVFETFLCSRVILHKHSRNVQKTERRENRDKRKGWFLIQWKSEWCCLRFVFRAGKNQNSFMFFHLFAKLSVPQTHSTVTC